MNLLYMIKIGIIQLYIIFTPHPELPVQRILPSNFQTSNEGRVVNNLYTKTIYDPQGVQVFNIAGEDGNIRDLSTYYTFTQQTVIILYPLPCPVYGTLGVNGLGCMYA